MIFTRHTLGFGRAATAATLAGLALTGSGCTKEHERYALTLRNGYFEALYHPQAGAVLLADTLRVGELTPEAAVERGSCAFSVETASGLRLSADIHLKGEAKKVTLLVNEQGKVLKE
ncbi:MAG: hypothetical protein LBF67_07205 [Prevotellaceae bacterium]|nr:hypothetical protein [Prevotellaceae bacterium]